MNKLRLSCLFTFLIAFSANAQDAEEIDCSDVKTGVFFIPSDDVVSFSTKIVRTENFQREYISDGTERTSRLKWLSDCTYIMLPDEKKEGEDPSESLMRQYGGIEITYVKRKGDTIYFTARPHKMKGSFDDLFYMIKKE
ncbi:MAG: hypothetical protein AB8B65_06505 [Kordia sp.]|uniref:hypothetical protein n=1 Tax=Kordia sp. TaxID=1965332 RepID=UPI003858C0DC